MALCAPGNGEQPIAAHLRRTLTGLPGCLSPPARPQGSVFLKTLGLNPDNTLANVGALVAFYAATVLLAFALYAFGMWRHVGHSGLTKASTPPATAGSGGAAARGGVKARGL